MIVNNTVLEASKQQVRTPLVKLTLNYDTPVTLYRDSIVNMAYTATGKAELGCIEDVVISIQLIKGALTDAQFNKKITADVYMGFNDSYVKLGTFKAQRWGERENLILIELGNSITAKDDVTHMVSAADVSLKKYIEDSIKDMTGKTPTIAAEINDTTLSAAYLYYRYVLDQIRAFAFATNSVARLGNDIEFAPYVISDTAADTLTEGNTGLILSSKKSSDYLTEKKTIQILLSIFNKSICETLYSSELDLSTEDLNIDCGSPVIIRGLNFSAIMQLGYFIPNVFGCKLKVVRDSVYVRQAKMEILGGKITSTVLGKTEDPDITYLSNPYIQNAAQRDALNKDIYNATAYTISYRGCPCYQVGDVLTIPGIGNMLVTKQSLVFDGGLTGTLEGVVKDGV